MSRVYIIRVRLLAATPATLSTAAGAGQSCRARQTEHVPVTSVVDSQRLRARMSERAVGPERGQCARAHLLLVAGRGRQLLDPTIQRVSLFVYDQRGSVQFARARVKLDVGRACLGPGQKLMVIEGARGVRERLERLQDVAVVGCFAVFDVWEIAIHYDIAHTVPFF